MCIIYMKPWGILNEWTPFDPTFRMRNKVSPVCFSTKWHLPKPCLCLSPNLNFLFHWLIIVVSSSTALCPLLSHSVKWYFIVWILYNCFFHLRILRHDVVEDVEFCCICMCLHSSLLSDYCYIPTWLNTSHRILRLTQLSDILRLITATIQTNRYMASLWVWGHY